MEIELEPRVKPLTYKIKSISRESATQKASHVLDTDLRNHWSTGTNTKEWILLELDEPCLLSQVRIYNKSVLEWEISVGLHYKPETFSKVRPRCEAPRRDMTYPMNCTACKFVRISCLRGNPIAIFFIQLIGVPVAGLEPEFHPVLNYLLPHIISHKQDAQDMHLQLLQDLTSRLVTFLPQLESDLNSFSDAAEPTIRFLAMLSGPFYPILHIVNEREIARSSGNASDAEASKNSLPSQALTVSSNFEPRRSRNALVTFSPASTSIVFRPDVIVMLLRKAYKDSHLGTVCRMASRALRKLAQHIAAQEAPVSCFDGSDSELFSNSDAIDYSSLFGEEFRTIDDHWETKYLDFLDIKAVEEGILHVLYACVSQPLFCSKLAESSSDFWLTFPLIQALLPALRPNFSSSDQVDDNFSQWRQSFVQQALSQIVAMSTSPVYRSLLHGCAGYLSSSSPSHAKSACVLIDLCSGVLSPWLAQVIAKVDLVVELVEDLLGIIRGAHNALGRARAALKYIVLALSGHMDDIMAKYKEVKHKVLFLIEILEPFLDPALTPSRSVIAFGNVSPIFLESQEHSCTLALNVIRTAVRKSAILPSLESEWRRGSVSPSVLLSILEPHMKLPPNVDLCTFPTSDLMEPKLPGVSPLSSTRHNGGACLKSPAQDEADRKADVSDTLLKTDSFDDASLLFAPTEVRDITLLYVSAILDQKNSDFSHRNINSEEKHSVEKKMVKKHRGEGVGGDFAVEYSNLHADYVQLMNFRDCELWASEFRRLALDLHSQTDITPDSHNASIDALLLAAECYINPSFMISFRDFPKLIPKTKISRTNANFEFTDINTTFGKNADHLETVARLEWKRDKIVVQILLEAAELHQKYQNMVSDTEDGLSCSEENDEAINVSLDDMTSVDAITLVRQNQALLCKFLIGCLLKERHSMREILMQSLVFLLHSSTKLYCAPEDIIYIILESAEYVNGLLSDYYHQSKEGGLNGQLESKMVHELERHWLLLRRLVIASSGSEEGSESSINIGSGTRFTNLIPPSAWLQKIPTFSSSTSPVVRFVGWMAVSRNAKQYQKERLFLAANLSQLTILLSIFADELSVVDDIVVERDDNKKSEMLGVQQDISTGKGHEFSGQNYEDQSFRTIYPETSWFFPNLKEQFNAFGETILEAIRLHLRSLSSTVVPDLLCWFADLCSWPLLQKEDDTVSFSKSSFLFKGFLGKNAKVVILYILETIVIEHMEAMVPETPRVVQVLVSLCRTSYCDVPFLNSILCLLKPIISYSLKKVIDEELLVDDSCLYFESLCFDELLSYIKCHNEKEENVTQEGYSRAPTILVLASVFPDLSFQRKREIFQWLGFWANFASFEPTTSFYDYICAFQMLLESCKVLQVGTLRVLGVIPLKTPLYPETNNGIACDNGIGCDNNSEPHACFLSDVYKECENNVENTAIMDQKGSYLSMKQVVEFSKDLESLIFKLYPTMELCWKLHYQLAKKLTLILAECFVYSRCLSAVLVKVTISEEVDKEYTLLSNLVDNFHWKSSLEGLAQLVLALQEKHCWEVSSMILNCLLGGTYYFSLDNVISSLCSALKRFSCSAPKIAWRLQTDAWLSSLFARGVQNLHGSEEFLVDLLCSMLRHPEPEQRYIAIKQLGNLFDQDVYGQTILLSSTSDIKLSSTDPSTGSPASILSPLASSTWDLLSLLASSDTSVLLRSKAMELLVKCVPFAERHQLQSLLGASDSVLPSLRNLGHQACEGPMTQLSLALIVVICLYSPPEDICLIPPSIWRDIETLGMSEVGTRCDDPGRKACHALCRLQKEGDKAKVVLKEVILSSSSKERNPDFESTRESLLQVLGNLTSVQSYFDFFSKKTDEKLTEIEEAEIEMDLLQKEQSLQDLSIDFGDWQQLPFLARYKEEDSRLQQIKNAIRLLEKAKLKEEVIARRQKKLLLQHARQKYLEDAALHEAQLLQELDRERATEMEKEIERQRLLELERVKTRELRHNLDMEKEKQTQKELQREMEQVETGVRPSRRDLSSSTHSGRPRERFREREIGRTTNEGNLRTSSGSLQTEFANPGSSMPSAPTVVLSGSQQFSAQLPTILQSRDKPDDGGSSYEENFDGSRDSGDTGSVGDPDLVTALEGQTSGFGSGQIHGSRGNKSRQMMERRERDNRREGKWERKH